MFGLSHPARVERGEFSNMYKEGQGVAQDYEEAINDYKRA